MLKLIWDEFTWQRPASRRKGFVWEDTGDDKRLVLVPGATLASYQAHSGIYREFAGLKKTPEAVLQFANRYGPLQHRLEFNSLASWLQGIPNMKRLIALSDAVITGDRKKLSEALESFLYETSYARAAELRPIRELRKRRERASPDEQAQAAVLLLYHAIDPVKNFEGKASWNPKTGEVELRLKPADLLGFMLLQLGHALLGGLRVRPCCVCGKWVLRAGVGRADRKTCSAYCRLKLCRQRQKAVELYQQGWTDEKIAEQVRSELAAVKEWLSGAKGEPTTIRRNKRRAR